MIRPLLRLIRQLDRYEWVGIACGAILLAALTGVLGPSLDAIATYPADAASAAHAIN